MHVAWEHLLYFLRNPYQCIQMQHYQLHLQQLQQPPQQLLNRAALAIQQTPRIAATLQYPPILALQQQQRQCRAVAPQQRPLRGRGGPGRGGAAVSKLGILVFLQHHPHITLHDIQQLILACHTDWESYLCVGLNRTWIRLKRLCPTLCRYYLRKSDILGLISETTGPPLIPALHVHYSCHLSQHAQGRLQETDPVALHPLIQSRMHVPAYLNRDFHQYPQHCWILDRSRPKIKHNDDATELQQFWILLYLHFENNDNGGWRRVIHRRRYLLNSNTKFLNQVLQQYRIKDVMDKEGTPQIIYHDQSPDLCLQDVIAARQYLSHPQGLQHHLMVHSYGIAFRCQAEVEASISLAKRLKRKAIAQGNPNWRQFVSRNFVDSNF